MSATMCRQGLQSCLEPNLLAPHTLGFKVSPVLRFPLSSFLDSDSEETENDENQNPNIIKSSSTLKGGELGGGMSFLQTITKSSSMEEPKEDKEKHYVHPLVKQYSSRLSERSLELCTETLGCETGSTYGDIDMYCLSSSGSINKSHTKEKSKLQYSSGCRKTNHGSFPPPLTSISGSNCVNIIPHREGGRLVMKAVLVPSSTTTCFEAERSEGRLRLRYLDNLSSSHFDSEAFEEEQEPEEEEEEEEEQEHEEEHEHEHIHQHEHEAEVEKADDEGCLEEEIDGCEREREREMEKFQRPRRCKEDGRGNIKSLIWEPCWVVTS